MLKTYDLASAGLVHPEDVTYAPSSLNPAIKNIYLTDRGLDNNDLPNENDGRIFEINLGIPRVASIQRASANPSGASSVNFTVTFSESVTGVDVTDFSLNAPGISGAAISLVSGSGTTRTVTVNTGSGNGTIRLDVVDDNTIRDTSNIELGGSSTGDGNFITGEVYTINKALPAAATLVSPSGSITTNNPTYTWNKVLDASWYYLYVSGPSGYVFTQWYHIDTVCGASTCSIANATTLGAGSHTFWVQTWNNVGYGPWSTGMSFNPMPPAAATLVSPSGSITTNNPTYTWNKVNRGQLVLSVCQWAIRLCVYKLVSHRCRLWCQHMLGCQCHHPGCWITYLLGTDLEQCRLWSLEHRHELHDDHARCRNLELTQRRHDQQSDLQLEQGQ